MELADRLLDDLFAAIDNHGGEVAKEAKTVLENWDREANADSKGAWLFNQWAFGMQVWRQDVFEKPWSMDAPRSTPDGLADPAKAVEVLEYVCQAVKENFGTLDVAWGEAYQLRNGEKTLPATGANGLMGVFRVAWGSNNAKGGIVGGGDSYVAIVEFGDKVKAKVALSYGNSSEKDSPHNGDQLTLFSKKEYRDALLDKKKILEKAEKIEELSETGFEKKNIE